MNVPCALAACDDVPVGPLELAFPSTVVVADPGVSVSREAVADAECTTYDVVPSSFNFSAEYPEVLDELDAEPSSTSAMTKTGMSGSDQFIIMVTSCHT